MATNTKTTRPKRRSRKRSLPADFEVAVTLRPPADRSDVDAAVARVMAILTQSRVGGEES